ncbi:MAG: hypothetical protein KDB07_07740, partial [Planctomycetes bacterium]|nr:hypothetical protein [Planctomycetota bacterium]
EPIVILWYTVRRGEESKQVIRDIVRIEGSKDEATRLTFYYFCKDVLYAVAKELGVEALDNEYHYPIG